MCTQLSIGLGMAFLKVRYGSEKLNERVDRRDKDEENGIVNVAYSQPCGWRLYVAHSLLCLGPGFVLPHSATPPSSSCRLQLDAKEIDPDYSFPCHM